MRPIDADTIFPNGQVLVWEKDGETTANYILKFIKDAPTLDVEPVRHGRWIEVRDKFNYCIGMKCSKCGRRVRNCGENYCPNCGANMDAKEEKE